VRAVRDHCFVRLRPSGRREPLPPRHGHVRLIRNQVRNNPPDGYYDGSATRPCSFKNPHRTSFSSEAGRDVNVIGDTGESGPHGRRAVTTSVGTNEQRVAGRYHSRRSVANSTFRRQTAETRVHDVSGSPRRARGNCHAPIVGPLVSLATRSQEYGGGYESPFARNWNDTSNQMPTGLRYEPVHVRQRAPATPGIRYLQSKLSICRFSAAYLLASVRT
jgi:hypothetical protein